MVAWVTLVLLYAAPQGNAMSWYGLCLSSPLHAILDSYRMSWEWGSFTSGNFLGTMIHGLANSEANTTKWDNA